MIRPTVPVKQFLSWAEFHTACNDLTDRLRGDKRITKDTVVVGVPRGGLVAATIIAYGLRLEPVIALPVYRLEWYLHGLEWGSNLLFIDDICDTGRTFEDLRLKFGKAVYAAPYVKPKGRPLCDHYSRSVTQNTWVVFPYAPDDQVNR